MNDELRIVLNEEAFQRLVDGEIVIFHNADIVRPIKVRIILADISFSNMIACIQRSLLKTLGW